MICQGFPLLEASEFSVSIDEKPILRRLSFQVGAGAFTGIIGPNGSGKTTLLRAISGILRYEGALTFQGKAVHTWEAKALARNLAVLQQAQTVAFDFSVLDYVMMGRLPHKGWLEPENAEDLQRTEKALAALDLRALAQRKIPSLSGGERQRVLLAQALVQDTPLLLLDEPTAHLDVYHQFDFLERVRKLVKEGKTVIAVFHDLTLAARFTDSLLVLQAGSLVAHGDTRSTLTAPLIQQVFRMNTRVYVDEYDHPNILYHNPA